MKKACLRLVGGVGAVVFATLFALTYSVPDWVEKRAAGFIQSEVTENVDTRIDNIGVPSGGNTLSQVAVALSQKSQREIEELKNSLKAGVHEKMATALAQIRNLDCECRDTYARLLENGFLVSIESLQTAKDMATEFIQMTYMQVASELKRDLRIFTAANAGIFLLLFLVSFLKPQAMSQLFVPGVLLTLSTLVSAFLYVFEQNWILTIIYGDYLGFLYLIYLGVAFLALCDVVLNRARVTTRIANVFLEAVGSAVNLAPC
jgi:hypothetical protein